MIQKLLLVVAGLMWGGLSFLLGLYVTFPADIARDRVVYEFGEWSRGEYALGIGDLSLWRLSGVDLDDVTFYTVKKGRKTKNEPAPLPIRQPMIHLDGLAVRAAPLAMLMGKDALAFVAEIYGGALHGQFAQSEAGMEVSFDGGDIDLGRLPVVTEQVTLNLLGVASGDADLYFDAADVKSSTGSLNLSFEGLGLGPESVVGGFGLPEVSFGKAGVAFEVKDGKMSVTEGAFESDILTATLSGDIVLNKKLVRSRNRLELVFSLPEDLDKLAQIAPDLKRSRDDEGKYHVTIGGTILAPSVRFSKSGAGRVGKSPMDGGPLMGDDGPGIQPDFAGGAADPEERRKAREERIRERRKRLKERREAAGDGGSLPREDRIGGPPDMERGPDGEELDPEMGEDVPMPGRFPMDGPMDGPLDGPLEDVPPPEFEE